MEELTAFDFWLVLFLTGLFGTFGFPILYYFCVLLPIRKVAQRLPEDSRIKRIFFRELSNLEEAQYLESRRSPTEEAVLRATIVDDPRPRHPADHH